MPNTVEINLGVEKTSEPTKICRMEMTVFCNNTHLADAFLQSDLFLTVKRDPPG